MAHRGKERNSFFDEKLETYKGKEVIVKIRNSTEAKNSFHYGTMTDYDKEYIYFGPGFKFLRVTLMIVKTTDEISEEREKRKKAEKAPEGVFYFQGFHFITEKMMSFFAGGYDDLDAFSLVYEKFHAELPDELYLIQAKRTDLVVSVTSNRNVNEKDFSVQF